MANPLIEFVERIRAAKPEYDWQPKIEQPHGFDRRLSACDPPDLSGVYESLEEARMSLRAQMTEYLETPDPGFVLLCKTLPGSGKTTAAVEAVEAAVERGLRVAYSGPRHDFYPEVTSKAISPENWYEWLPRQAGDDEGKLQTCDYPEQMNTWLHKGYLAMDFCAGVCGWEKVKSGCVYHQQKLRPERVIYVQHQHVTLGHPLQFDLLIGDESPLAAFLHEWRIPAKFICPPGMSFDEPLTEILHMLSQVAQNAPRAVMGPDLIDLLGGADEVIQACETFELPVGEIDADIRIHRAEEAAEKPYFHLFDLAPLLLREAKAHAAGRRCPQRIIASGGFLTLLLRRNVKDLPKHVIWLDATGKPEVYRKLFKQEVRVVEARPRMHGKIYQVVDRSNGKSTLIDRTGELTSKAGQMQALIKRIVERGGYQRPAVIGFKKFMERSEMPGTGGHFYAARGTNEHEDADAVIVAGAPQPDVYDVVKMAKQIYFEREQAFDPTWCLKDAPYRHIAADGMGRAYPVSGFWNDPDLQGVLEMVREDEIIQAAHRGRPVNHPVDIWLLTNIPIDGLPPDELLTMREVMDAPEGVDIFRWEKVQALMQSREVITVKDIQEAIGLSYEYANKYLGLIAEQPGWEMAAVKGSHGGKPTRQVRRPIAGDILN